MTTLRYKVLLRKEEDGTYIVPSLPGCLTFGHTVEDVFSVLQQNGFHMKLLQLRRDSGYEEKNILSSWEITESSMLFAWKQ